MSKKIALLLFVLCSQSLRITVSAKGVLHKPLESYETADTTAVSSEVVSTQNCDISLNFSNMGFERITTNFVFSQNVKNLTLRNNVISVIMKGAFEGLPNLEYLDLSGNQLDFENLFSFGGHANLKILVLDNNTVFSSYNQAGTFTSYSYESTERTPVHRFEINPAYNFPKLRHLSLRKTKINRFSATWSFNFPKLNYLDISENVFEGSTTDILNTFPISITKLVMESAGLTEIRSQQLKNFVYLNFNENNFETVTSRFCYERAICLQGLNKLIDLSIADCGIQKIEVDAFKDTINLISLDISRNRIKVIENGTFDFVPSLKKLNLSNNEFIELPNFSVLQNLNTLILDSMQILPLQTLPYNFFDSFTNMPNLQIISLRNNNLNYITPKFLNNFPSLREINLSNNNMNCLPNWQFQNVLRKLYLNFNQISNISDLHLNNAESLEILGLRNNTILNIKIEPLHLLPANTTLFI